MKETFSFCHVLLVALILLSHQNALCATSEAANRRHISLKNIRRRDLLQTTTICQTQCPSSSSAASACKSLSSSQQSSIRNTLISSCGMSTSTGGCCAAISGSQLEDYINCACAGDAVLSGLSAFVDASAVVKTCGCPGGGSGTSTQVQLRRSDLPSTITTPATTTTITTPATTTTTPVATPPASSNGTSSQNPIAAEIISSQGP